MNTDHAIKSLVQFCHHGLGNLRDGVRPNTCLARQRWNTVTLTEGTRKSSPDSKRVAPWDHLSLTWKRNWQCSNSSQPSELPFEVRVNESTCIVIELITCKLWELYMKKMCLKGQTCSIEAKNKRAVDMRWRHSGLGEIRRLRIASRRCHFWETKIRITNWTSRRLGINA